MILFVFVFFRISSLLHQLAEWPRIRRVIVPFVQTLFGLIRLKTSTQRGKCTEMSFLSLSRSILDIEQREIQVWKFETICLLGQEAPKSYIRLFKTQNACRVGLRKKWQCYFVFQNLREIEKCKSQRILFHLWHSFYVSPLYWSEKSHRAPHDT